MNLYKLIWKEFEAKYPLPRRARNIIQVEFKWFNKIIKNENKSDIEKVI